MKQILASKFLRKILMLAFMLGSLIFITSSDSVPQPVLANACCRDCDFYWYQCMEEGHQGYPTAWECYEGVGLDFCYNNCDPYCSGCNSSGDCPNNEHCTLGGVCQAY
jgi:hypothetical protein